MQTEFDRALTAWLVEERPAAAPDGLLAEVLDEVSQTKRRPGWLVPDRWTWSPAAQRLGTVARVAAVVATLALLAAALIALLAVVGAPRPAPPFGLARPGFIAFDTPEGVVVARIDGSDRRVLVPANGLIVNPTWSRDGLRLAFWHRPDSSGGPWSLNLVQADGSGRRQLAEGVTLKEREELLNQPSNLSWSPDSRRVAYAADVGPGSAIFVVDVDGGPARQIVDGSLEAIDPAWAPDGSVIAFQSGASATLHVVAPDGTGERQLTSLPDTIFWPDWSPDGKEIAVTAAFGDALDVFAVSANGSIVRNISQNISDELSPSWSPDGQKLAWARATGVGTRGWVVVADRDGTNQVEIREPADLAPPMWSPDGTRLYSYVVGPDDTFQSLLILDPTGVAPVVRVPAEGNLGNGNWQRLP